MKKILVGLVGLLVGIAASGQAAVANLTVDVPKTAYIEWLTASSDTMASVDGDNTYTIDAYLGGAVTQLTSPADKICYLGVMCNALTGYEVTLTGSGTTTGSTAQLTQAGATPITFTAALAQVGASFSGGTSTGGTLDLTGGSVSASTTHTAEADLPMAAASPNVWQITVSLPSITTVADGLIMSGTYTGSITATIALP
ncbi:MAG: hypothetical protein KDK78_02540 [Chlamydiia bacterium]|nr:hypothetical protein [Chlamydiia bacterium]